MLISYLCILDISIALFDYLSKYFIYYIFVFLTPCKVCNLYALHIRQYHCKFDYRKLVRSPGYKCIGSLPKSLHISVDRVRV